MLIMLTITKSEVKTLLVFHRHYPNVIFLYKFCPTTLLFLYNKFIETGQQLVNERCVMSFLEIDHR